MVLVTDREKPTRHNGYDLDSRTYIDNYIGNEVEELGPDVVSLKRDSFIPDIQNQYDIMIVSGERNVKTDTIAKAFNKEVSSFPEKTHRGYLNVTDKGKPFLKEERERSLVGRLFSGMLSGNFESKLYSFGGFKLRNGVSGETPMTFEDSPEQVEKKLEQRLSTVVNTLADDLGYDTEFLNEEI